LLAFFFSIGLISGAIASVMIYLTTYKEYVTHYPVKRARKTALMAGFIALFFFVVLSVILGYFLSK